MVDFLSLPARSTKPRQQGLTHVIDSGLSTAEAEGLMASAADYVDLVRLGWGSAYVTRDVREKIERYRSYGVPVMLGGTLTELAWLHGRVEELRRWLKELGAGAWKVITEGRETGTAGIFRPTGEMRTGLVDEIAHEIDVHELIFEAPMKSSQAWFVKHFGPEVNLGNIPPEEVIPLETLRLGLRADTLKEVLLRDEQPAAR